MDTKTEIPIELRAAVVAVETVVSVAEAVAVVAAVALVTDALVASVKTSDDNPGRIICKQTRHERSSN